MTTIELKAPAAPTLEEYWRGLQPLLPQLSPEEQRVGVAVYRELAKGRAVDADQLGRALGIPAIEARAVLARDPIKAFVHSDAQGRVLGFGGLAAAPMHHRFEVAGRTLWTWCAWDSLFIPALLGRPARITSPDPETREVVRLVVTPQGIESVVPDGAVISFINRDADSFGTSAADVMEKFCHFVFFFASRASGERWIAKHPDTFLYSLEDAAELAKRTNARRFGAALASRP